MSTSSQAQATLSNRASTPTNTASRRVRSIDLHPKLIDVAFLVVLIAGASAIYSVYALRVGTFQPDEWYYLELARVIANHFPAGLWQEAIYWRGIQRLDQLILAAPFAFARGASVYQAAHVIQAVLYASTALPVWLLARKSKLSRLASAFVAVFVLATPWAIVSTSFLAESAAYPAYAWVLYATVCAVHKPSLWRELLAIVAVAVAALSRTALIGLAPLLPIVVLWHAWSWELRGHHVSLRLRRLPAVLWSSHRLISSLTALVIVVLVLNSASLLPGGGLASLTGTYGLPSLEAFANVWPRYAYYLSRMASGTSFIALVLAIAWVLRSVVRPVDGEKHALAVVCIAGIAVILLSLLQAGSDERYLLYGAIPIALAFAAELESRWRGRASVADADPLASSTNADPLASSTGADPLASSTDADPLASSTDADPLASSTDADPSPPRAAAAEPSWKSKHLLFGLGRAAPMLIGTAAVILLLGDVEWGPATSEYDFFTYPAGMFFQRVVLGRLSVSHLPIVHLEALQLVQVGIAIVALLWIASGWVKRIAPATSAVLGVAVLALSAIQLGYGLKKFTTSGAAGYGGPSAAQRSWMEAEVPPGQIVTAVGIGLGETPAYVPVWRTAEFWNTVIGAGAAFQPSGVPTIPFNTTARLMTVSSPSGLITAYRGVTADGPAAPLTPYLLVPRQGTNPYGLAATTIANDPVLPVTLVRLKDPARIEWSIAGTSAEGFMPPGQPATVTVYDNALSAGSRCARFSLIAPPAFSGRWHYKVFSGGRQVSSGSLVAEQNRAVEVPLHPRSVRGGRLANVTIKVRGKVPYPNGASVSARVAFFTVASCRSELR